jgi:hypothetical protein
VPTALPSIFEHTVTTSVEVPVPSGAFSWQDADGVELRDPIEHPIAGVRVSLRDEFGDEIARTSTDDSGRYQFDELPVGQYTVVFTAPNAAISQLSEQARLEQLMAPSEHLAPTPIQTWTASRPASLRLTGTLA